MKNYRFVLLLFSGILFLSCHKYDTEQEQFERNLVGDYDWSTSESLGQNAGSGKPLYTYTPSMLEKNFGIRIKKKRKCFFYEDGTLKDSGKILSIEDSIVQSYQFLGTYTKYRRIIIDWNKAGNDTFSSYENGGTLWNFTAPKAGFRNYYKKK